MNYQMQDPDSFELPEVIESERLTEVIEDNFFALMGFIAFGGKDIDTLNEAIDRDYGCYFNLADNEQYSDNEFALDDNAITEEIYETILRVLN